MTNSLQQSISQMYAPRKPERRKGFVELSAELGLERDSIKGRIADIDAEVAKLDEAYTRAVTARANAALDGDRVGPAEAADAYLRGEDVRPGFAVVRAAVPGEEVLVGLRRRKDALLQERGTSTGRLRGIARELRIARLHDAVDLYLTSAEQLGDLWAEIIVSGEELRVAPLGLGWNTIRIPAPTDDFAHGTKDTHGVLYDADLLRERGYRARAVERLQALMAEWQ